MSNTNYQNRCICSGFFIPLKENMSNRNSFIKDFRGQTIGNVDSNSSAGERFQNNVLRPILKLQNDLLIEMCRNYFAKNKVDFQTFSAEKKAQAIENAIQKDIKFRNSIKGVVLGLFTIEEYQTYITDSSRLNKRMMTMVIERLKSQMQLFEENQKY